MKWLFLMGCLGLAGCGDNVTEKTTHEVNTTAQSQKPIQDYHDDSQNIALTPEIDKVISIIPNLKQGLKNSGLQVQRLEHGQYTYDDIKNSQGLVKQGDISYNFYTSEPSEKLPCPLLRSFMVDKRGDKWIPRTKTANYLMTGNCTLPTEK